ncbi:MAG: class I SAM-dependent methyltransferase, partial [Bryobacteraceae bacterium]
FEDGAFDFIYSWLTLQHMAPRYARAYLAEFARVLSPEGILVFRLPSQPAHKGQILHVRRWVAELLYLRLYHGVFRRNEPLMQMHGIKREEVLQLLYERGCEALVVEPDISAGSAWISYRYFVARQGQSGGANRAS